MIGLAVSMFLAVAPAAVPRDPLEPAMAGQVECYIPNVERRTCRSIGAYAKQSNGIVHNTSIVLISADPPATMETTAPVQVKGRAVCSVLTARDIATARFRIAGKPVEAGPAESLREAIAGDMKGIFGREVCASYAPGKDGALVAEVSLDGKRTPKLDQPVLWVSPADGYKVAP
jgi:hypothetical protein